MVSKKISRLLCIPNQMVHRTITATDEYKACQKTVPLMCPLCYRGHFDFYPYSPRRIRFAVIGLGPNSRAHTDSCPM